MEVEEEEREREREREIMWALRRPRDRKY